MKSKTERLRKFLFNALLLTGISLLMRTVDVGFNVYISNNIGAEAMGLFSLISGVYGFALTFATSGISLATTRLVAESLGTGDNGRVRASMKRSLAYSICFGCTAAIILFLSANHIGSVWLDDERTVIPLRLLSITLPLISITSCLRGYFSAVRRVYKNAVSQVCEQAVRIFATVYLLSALIARDIESACTTIIVGGALSDLLSFAVMYIMYLYDRYRHTPKKLTQSTTGLTSHLLHIALPVAFSTYARSGLLTLEHILIPIGLRKSGSSRGESLAAYGTLHSMVMPIVLFPSALISNFSGLLIPELAECKVRNNHIQIRYITSRVFQLSLLFSICVSGIMICFSSELGQVIYSSNEASSYIKLLAPLIPIMYLDTTTDSMLKGLGQQLYSMNINIIDASLSVLLVWILLPSLGINGYIITIFITEILNATFSIVKLISVTNMKTDTVKWIFKPLACIVGSTSVSKLLFSTVWRLPQSAFSLTVHITVSVILYFVFCIATFAVSRDDIRWIGSILHKSSQKKSKPERGSDAPPLLNSSKTRKQAKI